LNVATEGLPLFDAGLVYALDVVCHLFSRFAAVGTIWETTTKASRERDAGDDRKGVRWADKYVTQENIVQSNDSINFDLRNRRFIHVGLALAMTSKRFGLNSDAANNADEDSQRDVKNAVD
jgi:hypothetical protein